MIMDEKTADYNQVIIRSFLFNYLFSLTSIIIGKIIGFR